MNWADAMGYLATVQSGQNWYNIHKQIEPGLSWMLPFLIPADVPFYII